MIYNALHDPESHVTIEHTKESANKLSTEICARSGPEMFKSTDPSLGLAIAAGMEMLSFTRSFSKLEDSLYSEIILHRAQREPSDGLCDIVASRSAVFKAPNCNSRSIPCPSDFSFVTSQPSNCCESRPEYDPILSFQTAPDQYVVSRQCHDYDLDWAPGGILSLPDEMKHLLVQRPADKTHDAGTVFTPIVKPGDPCMLPFAVTVCQEPSETYWATSQRCALYLASALDLYAHLGIKDHPVWGLMVGGARCVVLMAQRSSVNDVSEFITPYFDVALIHPYCSGRMSFNETLVCMIWLFPSNPFSSRYSL